MVQKTRVKEPWGVIPCIGTITPGLHYGLLATPIELPKASTYVCHNNKPFVNNNSFYSVKAGSLILFNFSCNENRHGKKRTHLKQALIP